MEEASRAEAGKKEEGSWRVEMIHLEREGRSQRGEGRRERGGCWGGGKEERTGNRPGGRPSRTKGWSWGCRGKRRSVSRSLAEEKRKEALEDNLVEERSLSEQEVGEDHVGVELHIRSGSSQFPNEMILPPSI